MESFKFSKEDMKVLEKKAQEFAMKGAIEEIEKYYTGYNSHFKKKIREELESKTTSILLELPDIIGLINESLTKEIDEIANNSIAESFIPLAKNALTRVDGEVKFSEILQEFVNSCNDDFKDNYYPTVSVTKSENGWLDIELIFTDYRDKEIKYNIILHSANFRENGEGKYHILSLPRLNTPYNYTKTMKLSNGDSTIEMPFTRDTLKDEFTSYIARLVISRSLIIMDCDDFDEDMFVERPF